MTNKVLKRYWFYKYLKKFAKQQKFSKTALVEVQMQTIC